MSTEIIESNNEVVEVVDENTIQLGKVYNFEGKKYSQINMNGLYEMTGEDMIQVNRILNRSGAVSFNPEMELEFALNIAARATELPVEFYKQLNMRDSMKVKNKVISFLFNSESIQ